jgi:MioC protein
MPFKCNVMLYFELILRENKNSYILTLEHPFLKSKSTQSNGSVSVNSNVLVVYGTCSGNAEVVSQAIRDGLIDAGLKVELKKAELTKAETSKEYGLIVLVSSTWDVGKLNLNYIAFDRDFKELDLTNHYVAVVGLGDSKNYDVFCGAADIMEESVKKTKAMNLVSTLRIDGEVYSKLDEFRGWGKHLGETFLSKINS